MGFNSAFKGLKSDKNNRYFTWRPVDIYDNISLHTAWIRNVSDKTVETNKKRIACPIVFFENFAVREITREMYCTADKATRDNIAHAHCILDN